MSAPLTLAAPTRTAPRLYYGWVVVALAATAMVGTLPGRTQGLGLITEPLLADLGLNRVTYAAINFWATLIGAGAAVGVGRLVDRLGSRAVLTGVAATLGLVVCLMSQTARLPALAISLTLTRALGQSALSVVSLAMVGQWFIRRIDRAMAMYSLVTSIGFMIAFPVVGSAIQTWGWRTAWLSVGGAICLVLAPSSWFFARRNPEACGLRPDGEHAGPVSERLVDPDPVSGYTWRAAVATPAFWIFAIGAALYGLVASGIGLFNESILVERGLTADIYYESLVVTAFTGLAGNFLGGWISTRVALTRLLSFSLAVLTGGLAVLPYVSARWHVVLWAAAMGLGGGLVMVLFFAVWPRVFGRRHLGQIQGAAQAITVVASAIGPVLLAWCVDRTGSYAAMFQILAGVMAAAAVSALIVSLPQPYAAAGKSSPELSS